jgi:hypothetical protein
VADIKVPGLPFPLSSAGHPPCQHRLEGEALVLTGGPRTDLFIDPAGATAPFPDPGRLSGLPPAGDFTLATRVTVGFASTFDAGVIVLDAAERRWAKLCHEYSPQHRPTAVTVVTRGVSDDCNSFEASGPLWLRVARSGRAWAFHASADGGWWRLLRYFSLGEHDAGEQVRVGFLAQSPTGEGCTASFDRIAFRAGAPSDLRDGS